MTKTVDFSAIRRAMANFQLWSRVEPNEAISLDRAFLPGGHRGVLDARRQLVVGNRGMGKSFWTHALLSPILRARLADFYGHKQLNTARVEIGFNGSDKLGKFAPTTDEISGLHARGTNPEVIWRAVLLRVSMTILNSDQTPSTLGGAVSLLQARPDLYSISLSNLDNFLVSKRETLIVVFDALDRLGRDWTVIRALSKALLGLAVGLQSFSAIRAKIFMRIDQFSDHELFRFPDSSKIRNDHVNLVWRSNELYGLLLFEVLRDSEGGAALRELAEQVGVARALPVNGVDVSAGVEDQASLIDAIAGEYMGSGKKRGRVFSWVPLHLSDAANSCSPRTFLIAWTKAAEHFPPPTDLVVDHLGLLDGVRSASTSRLSELYEDYPWIQAALDALRRQFVPMNRQQLFELWSVKQVLESIAEASSSLPRNAPVGLSESNELEVLLEAMKSLGVMEERANGKINVPDIYRVEAEILRKGGVAVPRRFS